MDTTTSKEGVYEFKNLSAGTYEVRAVASGFAPFTKSDLVIAAGQTLRLNIPLVLEAQQEKVTVNSTTTQLDVSPSNNVNAIVLEGKDLEALSDDPDEMASELQALSGPSAGPNGGQIYIDGFTAGQLPPKASIREIRINQNPFSSEYDKLGYGRIEIYTKPGTDKLHGQIMFLGNSSYFNARNPFENLPEGTSSPEYHSTQFSGSVGGPIGKKTSFFFNIERRDIEDLSIISAITLDSNFNIVPFSAAVPFPQTRTNVSPRIDYQLTPDNTLTVRYRYWRDVENNSGIGQFSLQEMGLNQLGIEHTIQITDTQTINSSTINEVRFQYIHEDTENTPVNSNPTVKVGGAFTGNGYGGGGLSDIQNRYELQEVVYKNFLKHSWKFGGRLRATMDTNATTAGFSGEFTFGSRLLPGCTPTPLNNCQITPIQAYQITEQGLANGLSIPQIQALGGGATYFNLNAGLPSSEVTLVDAGIFAQDDWKVRPNLTINYGLRFETQNNFPDHSNFAPRLGLAWGIGGSAKNPPKTIFRAGFGIFYDRFSYNLILEQQRLNDTGNQQREYLFNYPPFYLNNIPQCSTSPVSCPAAIVTVYQPNSNLHAPQTIQSGVTVERQVSRFANIAVTYLNSRGNHQFYTNTLNPADPVTGIRPNPAAGNIFQFQSEGTFKQNQLIVNGSIRMGTKISLFGYYTLNYASSDTMGGSGFSAGPTLPAFSSNPFDLQQDWGRASYDIRHRVFVGGLVGLPRGFRLAPFMIVSSVVPFNITTGTDPYQDSQYNVRPAFAACSAATQTKFGCFDAAPPVGYTPIPVNFGDGPGRFSLNLRVSKTFGFGPVVEKTAGVAGPQGGGGTFGRGPGRGGIRGGSGGFGGRADAGATNSRYSLTFAVIGRNIFNNVNVLPPVGNLGSPLFGESNGLAGRPFSDPTSNRRLDLQLTFTF